MLTRRSQNHNIILVRSYNKTMDGLAIKKKLYFHSERKKKLYFHSDRKKKLYSGVKTRTPPWLWNGRPLRLVIVYMAWTQDNKNHQRGRLPFLAETTKKYQNFKVYGTRMSNLQKTRENTVNHKWKELSTIKSCQEKNNRKDESSLKRTKGAKKDIRCGHSKTYLIR